MLRGHLTPPSAPGGAAATSAGDVASLKEPVVEVSSEAVHAQCGLMPRRQPLAGAHGRAPREAHWQVPSARDAEEESYRRRLLTDITRQLSQSQKVHRHDRCCPRREQTWEPMESRLVAPRPPG